MVLFGAVQDVLDRTGIPTRLPASPPQRLSLLTSACVSEWACAAAALPSEGATSEAQAHDQQHDSC